MLEQVILRRRQTRFGRTLRDIPRSTSGVLRILDIGGTSDYWRAMPWQALAPIDVTLLNVMPQTTGPPFRAVVGDGRDLSQFPNGSFDLVFSNSVLGHVGRCTDQQRMASEIRRVGRCYVVQTPNQYFPIDWRTLVPGFHWLPVPAQAWCFLHFRVGRYRRVRDPKTAYELATRIRNLTGREMRALFPDAQLWRERMLGFTKSFVAIHEFD